MISVHFQGKAFNITVIQVCALTSNAEEAEVEQFYEDLEDLEIAHKKGILFVIGDWNAKVGSQEISGVTGKFGLGVQNPGQLHCRSIKKCRMNLRNIHALLIRNWCIFLNELQLWFYIV